MTFHALKWLHACLKADLSQGARALASVLVPRSDKDGVCCRAQVRLADDLNATPRSVRRWVRELEAAGLLTTSKWLHLTMAQAGHHDPVAPRTNRTQGSGSTGHRDPVGENKPDTTIRSTGHSDPVQPDTGIRFPPHPPNRISPSFSPSSSPEAPVAPERLDPDWPMTGDRGPLPASERSDHAWLSLELRQAGVRGVMAEEARYALAYWSRSELTAAARVASERPSKYRRNEFRTALQDVAIPPKPSTVRPAGRPRKGLPVPVSDDDYLKDNPWV